MQPPAPERKRVCKLPNIHLFNQPENQVPPGIAAVSQTCNAQANEDDLDDLPSLKKLVIYCLTA